MDRNRAMALINESRNDGDGPNDRHARKMTAEEIIVESSLKSSGIVINAHIDDDEAMDALRLLIIQNRIAQENLSSENAAKSDLSLGPKIDEDLPDDLDTGKKGVDAGEVDSRLAGCGRISSSVLSALRLWKGGIVSNGELLELVQKDLQFLKQSAAFGSADETKLIEDSNFWGRFSFGERWAEKKARLAAASPHGSLPGWDLIGCIVKSNDDLRQEMFVMQLIELCAEAFQTAGLDLWVHPYEIVATGRSTGIIECVRNAMSFDSLKKRPGYSTDGLVGHFQRMTEIAADPFKALNEAKQNFVSSLAAYSLMSYLFMFKDRHNGNLLLDTAGHVIHIDFGFVFGIAPGGSFSLEQSTPFKLTDEMLEVMGGLGSPLFSEFVTLFCCGFLALQAHADTFLTVVEITCKGSNFHCFDGKDPDEIVTKLRERFCPELNKSQTVAYALDLIKFATTSYGTKQYDYFQYLSQGIAT
jgi:phosphatidylinositol 4-kinase